MSSSSRARSNSAASRRAGRHASRLLPADRLDREGDVVDHARAAKQPRDLERARQAVAGAPVRRPGGDVGTGEDDRAAVARELAAELRHQGRLAGAVRADQGVDLAGVDVQVDAIGRDQPAEALLEAAHVEQRRGRRASCVMAATARGAASTGRRSPGARTARPPAAPSRSRIRGARSSTPALPAAGAARPRRRGRPRPSRRRRG